MIKDFGDKKTECIFNQEYVKGLPSEIQPRALSKLRLIDAATGLDDLKLPPSNGLHPLSKKLKDFHTIKINKQWRIIFIWNAGGAEKVEITDYH